MACLTKLCTSRSFFEALAVSELAVNSSAAKAVEPSHLWAIVQMIFRPECTTSVIEIYWYSVMCIFFCPPFSVQSNNFLSATGNNGQAMFNGLWLYIILPGSRLKQGEATRVVRHGEFIRPVLPTGGSKVLLAGALWMKLQISPSLNQVPLM